MARTRCEQTDGQGDSYITLQGYTCTEMSKTFSACQTFGLTNLENLPDRMKTCHTEYKFYIVALLF